MDIWCWGPAVLLGTWFSSCCQTRRSWPRWRLLRPHPLLSVPANPAKQNYMTNIQHVKNKCSWVCNRLQHLFSFIFFLKKLNRKHEKGKAIWYMPVQGHAYNMCIVYKFPVHISCKFEFLVLEESCFTSNYMYKRCKCSFYWSDDDLLMRNYYEVNIHDKWMFDRRGEVKSLDLSNLFLNES